MSKRLPSPPPVLPGYAYVRPLGVGGFADVFLYEQDMPRRQVAVKVLLNRVEDRALLRMFNAEADIMARLSAHPSIMTVYEASISADGRPYLVMEYCPTSLAARFRLQPLAVEEVLHVGVKIASAVETAHRAGLLHRDIKPSNVLVSAFGVPVLADFGIATAATSDSEVVAMSLPWSAPEIIDESSAGSVASEMWSLGATLYTLLAGRSPFELAQSGPSDRAELKSRIARAKYVRTGRADVPPRLEQALERSLRRNPRDRWPTALDFAQELQAIQRDLGVSITPLEVAQQAWSEGDAAINMTNSQVRGAVRSSVAHDSPRATRGRRLLTDDQAPQPGAPVGTDAPGVVSADAPPSDDVPRFEEPGTAPASPAVDYSARTKTVLLVGLWVLVAALAGLAFVVSQGT